MDQTSNTRNNPQRVWYYNEMDMDDVMMMMVDVGDDVGVPLHVVVKMAISSLPIPPRICLPEARVLPSR